MNALRAIWTPRLSWLFAWTTVPVLAYFLSWLLSEHPDARPGGPWWRALPHYVLNYVTLLTIGPYALTDTARLWVIVGIYYAGQALTDAWLGDRFSHWRVATSARAT